MSRSASRRVAAVPQLACVGGCERARPLPSAVQCVNRGSSRRGGGDVQWECKGELPSRVAFGKTEVVCEG